MSLTIRLNKLERLPDKPFRPGACTIKHYGFVIYGKWPDFVVSYWLFSCQLQRQACTNTLAYYGIRSVFYSTGPRSNIFDQGQELTQEGSTWKCSSLAGLLQNIRLIKHRVCDEEKNVLCHRITGCRFVTRKSGKTIFSNREWRFGVAEWTRRFVDVTQWDERDGGRRRGRLRREKRLYSNK